MINDPSMVYINKNKNDKNLWDIKITYCSFVFFITKIEEYSGLTKEQIENTNVPFCKMCCESDAPTPNTVI
jgi:hypothetical protein